MLLPFGLLLDLWECHKQFLGLAKSSNRLFSYAWRNPGFFYAILKEVTTDGG